MISSDDNDQISYLDSCIKILCGFIEHEVSNAYSSYDITRYISDEYIRKSSTFSLIASISGKRIIEETEQSSSTEHYLHPQWYCQNQLLVLTLCQNARPPPKSRKKQKIPHPSAKKSPINTPSNRKLQA